MNSNLCQPQAGQDTPTTNTLSHTDAANSSLDAAVSTSAPALFSLGAVVATPPAIAELKRKKLSVLPFLWRHQTGDWSSMAAEDAATNRRALKNGGRVFSSFACGELTLWVITEAQHACCCRHVTEGRWRQRVFRALRRDFSMNARERHHQSRVKPPRPLHDLLL